MRIGVYTIAKNEQQFVERFMSNLNEADGVFVADTGSTDETVPLLRKAGAVVDVIKVDPWRFDIPRNVSLQLVPESYDICLSIDLDEILTPGWRTAIEKKWNEVDGQVDRFRYEYAWNHNPDGSPAIAFWYDKCHTRKGFRWVKPIHEVLEFYNGIERQVFVEGFMLHHWPDPTKSRGSYLSLLELAVRENQQDDRSCHYLGREYMYYGRQHEAIIELKRHLALPSARWHAERAASMRYISRCYGDLGEHGEAEAWAARAVAEAPYEREPWFELGKIYYGKQDLLGCYYAMMRALAVTDHRKTYIRDPEAWGPRPYDLAGVSAWWIGLKDQGIELMKRAIELDPTDERLKNNLQLAMA